MWTEAIVGESVLGKPICEATLTLILFCYANDMFFVSGKAKIMLGLSGEESGDRGGDAGWSEHIATSV